MADIHIFDLNNAETSRTTVAPSFAEAQQRFMALAGEIGLDLRDIHFGHTDDIVRCATTDDRHGKRSGWYVIHEEQGLLYGALGNWKTDNAYVKFTGREASQIDADLMRRVTEKQEARQREAAEMRRQNALEVAGLVRGLPAATDSHPYLQRKKIGANGALMLGDNLCLPISDLEGNVVSMQTINPRGDKTFRAGCTSKGVFVIGAPTPNAVICEGFATGASIHQATGMRVYVTFNAGTMASLAAEIATIEGQRNGARLVIAADNDRLNVDGINIGLKKAQQAADAIGGAEVLCPPKEGTDWNDVAISDPPALQAAFSRIKPLFVSWQVEDAALLPRRQWLYGHHYIRKFCSLTVAPGGLGKSTLVLTEAIAMATGRNLLGVQPESKLKVVYFNAEDPLDEIKARVHAICQAHGISQMELVGQLFVQSGRDNEINLATGDPGEVVDAVFSMVDGFLRFYGVDVIVLDPLANMHDSPETNELFRKISKRLSRLADARNCAIEIVHHTRKLNGMAASVEDSRGGSALIGAVRTARVLNPMEPEEATRFGLETYIDHFRIEMAGKNNLARPADKAEWYERYAVKIGNGDYIAVVKPWSPPDPFDGVTKEHARQVQQAIQKMDPPPRESVQAADWVGVTVASVLGANVRDAAEKARVKQIVKTWLSSGVLEVSTHHDQTRNRDYPVVVVGSNQM